MHSLTIEKIKKRIQSSMEHSAQYRKTLNASSSDISKQLGDFSSLNHQQLAILLNESEQNNRNWNVSPEYKITSHRRIIGRFIVLGKKVVRKFLRWYINPAFEKQRIFNGSVTRSINALSNIANYTSNSVGQIFEEVKNTQHAVHSLEDIMRMIAADNSQKFSEMIDSLEMKINMLQDATLDVDKKSSDALNELAQKHEQQFKQLQATIEQYQMKIEQFQMKIEQLDEMIVWLNAKLKRQTQSQSVIIPQDEHKAVIENSASPSSQSAPQSFDYFLFEQQFRGTRSAIKERQTFYLPYFQSKELVLDIGCGRGEFIELLIENGVKVKGIDLNQDMVDFCREKGFDVERINVFDYLSTVNDNTFDGIFMAQVVEHLSTDELLNVVSMIYRVLKPGGLFVVETINVQSVYAMSNWFYLDPTHVKPVHPETLKFFLKQCGFKQVNMEYLSPVTEKKIDPLHIEGVDTTRFNQSIQELQGLIYGHQDYALFAYK
jgi:2-polyprenyl-3-methyl-5-hydroxy-6-metoxy-1,4-benzoquinol methylase